MIFFVEFLKSCRIEELQLWDLKIRIQREKWYPKMVLGGFKVVLGGWKI